MILDYLGGPTVILGGFKRGEKRETAGHKDSTIRKQKESDSSQILRRNLARSR
jgi:hypothetical protein